MRELRTQYQKKVNVWASILNNTLIVFIEENLNIEIYKNMLKNQIVPAIRTIVGKRY